jgi:vacuolar-type H+-ATPase subunit F/Vma7
VTTAPDYSTRMIFMGDDTLGDGFRLIGFETWPNPSHEEVDTLLRQLSAGRENAFVIVDEPILRANIPSLRQVRREGGRVVVVAVPPLQSPGELSVEVARQVQNMFGSSSV